MRSLLNPESPAMRFLTKIGYTIILNLLWFLCSLPLFTIGASTYCIRFLYCFQAEFQASDENLARPLSGPVFSRLRWLYSAASAQSERVLDYPDRRVVRPCCRLCDRAPLRLSSDCQIQQYDICNDTEFPDDRHALSFLHCSDCAFSFHGFLHHYLRLYTRDVSG